MPITTEHLLIDSEESQLHTEELQEIITSTPKWLIRYGISIFMLVIMGVIGISFFIQYPDVTNTRLTFRSNNQSTSIAPGQTGIISEILVKPNQPVKTGEALAYLKNAADAKQVIVLTDDLMSIQRCLLTDKKIPVEMLKAVNSTALGDLLPAYQRFYLTYRANMVFIQHKNWERLADFIQELNKMADAAKEWKSKYVLSSPTSGRVAFSNTMHVWKTVSAGEELFYIDAGEGELFGEIQIPKDELNKVKTGMKVIATVSSPASNKHEKIEGRIESISEFPSSNGNYVSKVSFKRYNRSIINSLNLRAGTLANAEILTQDINLFTRLMQGILKKGSRNL